MTQIFSDEEFCEVLEGYCLPANWRDECTLTEPTMTPGVFYHGSPEVNIARFKAEIQTEALSTTGLFFTQVPSYAAWYAMRHSEGLGGRIYRVELATKNPYYADVADWIAAKGVDDRIFEREAFMEAKAQGHDAIVSVSDPDKIGEIIVISDDVVRLRDTDVRTVKRWDSQASALESLVLYQAEDAPAPDYAPDCLKLFGKRGPAAEYGEVSRVMVDALNPLYCDQAVWPHMHIGVLRYLGVGALIDPRDGNGLVLERSAITPINRTMLRHARKLARRKSGLAR